MPYVGRSYLGSKAPDPRTFPIVAIIAVLCAMPAAHCGSPTVEVHDPIRTIEISCQFGEIFMDVTKSCEPCTKWCPDGMDSSTCPSQCAPYYNKLRLDKQQAMKDQPQEPQSEAEEKSPNLPTHVIIIIIVLGVGVVLLFGGCCVWRCLQRSKRKASNCEPPSYISVPITHQQGNQRSMTIATPGDSVDETSTSCNGSSLCPSRLNYNTELNSITYGNTTALDNRNERPDRTFAEPSSDQLSSSDQRTENIPESPQPALVDIQLNITTQ